MAVRKRDAFEVKLKEADLTKLTHRLCEEIEGAFDARRVIVGDNQQIDKWHKIYEGGDRKIVKNTPWPGAANLTSWIGTEKVDAFRARVVKTLFAEPIWIVTGWGTTPEQNALVEQFHQWTAEEERLQTRLSKVVHNGLIEGTGVLEVAERPVIRKQRQRIRALAQMNEDGVPITDAEGVVQPQFDESGRPVQAPEGTDPNQTTIIIFDELLKVRSGPQYRLLSLKDFAILPGHAKEREDVWGYAKRFWKRMPELVMLQNAGVYRNIEELGEDDEREQTPDMEREGQLVAPQKGASAEKELYELTYLDDLDRDGIPEWYVVTLSVRHRVILRIQRDDLGQSRYLLFTPFPRSNFIYGYSLIGHKLETIIDEHTAWRNMIADRVNMVVNAPLKRRMGSLWNPRAVPWGPRAIIDVREMNEVEAMEMPDLPSSVVHREGSVLAASERVAGMVDTAAGVHPTEDRTLGEVRTVHGESLIRIEEVVKHLQEAMEDLFFIRHEIWKRTLRANPRPIPNDLMVAMENRGYQIGSDMITAENLEGRFRGKPRGSVETADFAVMRQDFIGLMTALTQFSQTVPTFGVLFQDPNLGKALMDQIVRIFRWENPEAFKNALQKATEKAQQMIEQGGAPGGAPGGPAGGGAAGGPNAMTRGANVPAQPRRQGSPPERDTVRER